MYIFTLANKISYVFKFKFPTGSYIKGNKYVKEINSTLHCVSRKRYYMKKNKSLYFCLPRRKIIWLSEICFKNDKNSIFYKSPSHITSLPYD